MQIELRVRFSPSDPAPYFRVGATVEAELGHWSCGKCVALRVEFLLKTDSGYAKDTGVKKSYTLRFPRGKDLCGIQQSNSLFCLWFSRIFKISHWNTCGIVRASAVTWHNPIPPYSVREVGWASVCWRALGPSARIIWGDLGYATLQPTPEPSHKHFSERFWKLTKTISKFTKTTSKNRDFVVYHKGLFLVGNATRRKLLVSIGLFHFYFIPVLKQIRPYHPTWYISRTGWSVFRSARRWPERGLWFPTSDCLKTRLISSGMTLSRQ